ncbi:MAG: deoxynucleoside kinase [Andreesenia angusta]|nr:deoxynucleoside kinase [Andreesenia angusta]
MAGKLIIIESGVDGSGKATQTELLYNRLLENGNRVKRITFPNYDSDSSAIVKMYLNGDFGKNPEDVDPYISSTFFTIDRYASFKKEWEKYYNDGYIIISDRYTTSNMIHQSAKMDKISDIDEYIEWLEDYEYNFYKIPRPDFVIFLDVDPETSFKLIESRKNEIDGSDQKDIHEANKEYLKKSYRASKYISEKYNWNIVNCMDLYGMKSIEDINEKVYELVMRYLDN